MTQFLTSLWQILILQNIQKEKALLEIDLLEIEKDLLEGVQRGRREFDQKGYSLTLICPEDVGRVYNIEFEYELSVVEIDVL